PYTWSASLTRWPRSSTNVPVATSPAPACGWAPAGVARAVLLRFTLLPFERSTQLVRITHCPGPAAPAHTPIYHLWDAAYRHRARMSRYRVLRGKSLAPAPVYRGPARSGRQDFLVPLQQRARHR